MTRKNLTTLMCVLLPLVMLMALNGCAFRDGSSWDTGDQWGKKEVVQEDWAKQADLDALEGRVTKLEGRADENNALAQKAYDTADKALKCCRKEYTVIMTEEIFFDFNKFDVRTADYAALQRIADKLKGDPDLIAECQGHTDGVGNVDYNIVLGQKRADAARLYLINQHNIAMGRLAIRTFGKDAPVASNDTEDGRAKNRRVTIDVLGFAQ